MIIRNVNDTDLPELLALIQAKAEFDGCSELLVATVDSLRAALFAQRPLACALVAEVDGRLVGIATYYAIFSSFIAKPALWLDDLFVYESYRNFGIGEALVKELCCIAKAGGCGRVDWHVADLNTRGKKFYRRLGASISEGARLVRLDEEQICLLAGD